MHSDPKSDAHVDAVSREILRRGKKFFIFNPATYPTNAELTVKYTRSLEMTLTWKNSEIDLSGVASIWYRRPGDLQLERGPSRNEADWIR